MLIINAMTRAISEYRIVTGTGGKGLFKKQAENSVEQKVNELIREGWTPTGGLVVFGSMFYQAMVKYASE